ncbi:NAD(P)/FAD-dependent oxidoreductase [Spirulina subsalsa FACHB-351]|uniref:NAD(P)/FAD-dependent oxidoreductase n=1 Tax=Spirulina subsalsa FACHB-351 TaxID=234711 RepID=A0ABT3L3K1_9CYAN|nr:NAD(P)/FAD-dependent oxidoreductase [Spirulina subsalsa]MCW6036074.1 NAD(P)/FAD-dependent oxidoreductase [Spirulina subsalsa FACHB-351]
MNGSVNNQLQILVIGGGAAGFFGAITAAGCGAKVTLLEAGRVPLGKVRISGGGRCNVTHHCFDAALFCQNYPRGGKALRGALTRFGAKDTVAWFESRGVRLKAEADGRMFPVTDDSGTIVDCLLEAARKAGVLLRTGCPVQGVQRLELGGFEVGLKSGEGLRCDRLLIATGSHPTGYRWAQSLGHQIIPPVPSLFTFNLQDPRLQGLAGLSVDPVTVHLQTPGKLKFSQTGPLLITHWGLSGPAILKLSAWGARVLQEHQYKLPLRINWLPEFNPETLRQHLLATKQATPKRKITNSCPVSLPKRLWQRFLTTVGIEEQRIWAELPKTALNALVQELTGGEYHILGKGVFKEEFVTCGGIKLGEINFKTMESRCCPGLYFAGEILDIDGITGGFNFQNAWTTGWLAGQGIGNP